MKKRFSVIFILIAFILSVGSISIMPKAKVRAYSELSEEYIKTSSQAAYLIDSDTGTVIYSKNENEQLPIASMCKIMTLLLCFDNISNGVLTLDENICISENASGMGGSQIFLETNGEYPVSELLKGIIVASANDACVAMAERLYGSEDNFVVKMNEKANELSMNNTVFTNCTGLPKPGQHSSAKDVAKMFSELIKHKEYFLFSKIWTGEIKHPENRITEISNTNKLIRFYDGCDSGKTGYTNEAGHCLCASANRNKMRLICAVIHAPDSKSRFKDVSSLFNYGFSNFTNKLIIDNENPLELVVDVKKGKKDTVEVIAESPVYLFMKKNDKRSVEMNFIPADNIKAPLKKGDILGKLVVYENGIEISSVNVLSNENIERSNYFDNIKDIAINWELF